jgi:hypothetical protein
MRYVSRWLRPVTAHVKSPKGPVASLRPPPSLVRRIIPDWRLACLPWWPAMVDSAIVQGGCITTYQHTDHDNHPPQPYLCNTRRLHYNARSHPDHNTRISRHNRANADIRLQAQPWPNVCNKVVAPAARDSHSSSLCFWVSCDLKLDL